MAKRGRKELEDKTDAKVPFRIYPKQKWVEAIGEVELRRIGYLAAEEAYNKLNTKILNHE